jgi:hypothetical protein
MPFVPELEIPHLNAKALSWASLNVGGILSAMHGRFVGEKGSEAGVAYATRLGLALTGRLRALFGKADNHFSPHMGRIIEIFW